MLEKYMIITFIKVKNSTLEEGKISPQHWDWLI